MSELIDKFKNEVRIYIDYDDKLTNINCENQDLKSFKKGYNKKITNNIPRCQAGVYIWEDALSGDILYIGMAGKIARNGELKKHCLRQRLKASRGKNDKNKDVTTGEFLFWLLTNPSDLKMKKFEHLKYPIISLNIHLLFTKKSIPSTLIESIILNTYYEEHSELPILNLAF
jgi:hypothetical protein